MHALFVLFSKTVKLAPHFARYPSDLRFLPAQLAFAYLHGAIRLYALATVTSIGYEARPVAGVPEDSLSETLRGPGKGDAADEGRFPLREEKGRSGEDMVDESLI